MSRLDRSVLMSAGVAQAVERVLAVAFGNNVQNKKKRYDGVRTPTFNSIQLYESSYNFHFFSSYKLANGIVKYMFTTVGKF